MTAPGGGQPAVTFSWRPFLEQYSREILADRRIRSQVSEEVLRSGWMGFEPATQEQLCELETGKRVGLGFPWPDRVACWRMMIERAHGPMPVGVPQGSLFRVEPPRYF